MKITISKDAICGKIFVPKGEYLVALATDTQQIMLTGGGNQFKVPAVRRRSSGRTKITTVSYSSGGGAIWSLVVSAPKLGEWISMFEVGATAPQQHGGKKPR